MADKISIKRGLVVIETSKGIYLQWRSFSNDPIDIQYIIYRNDKKIGMTNKTNYVDSSGTKDNNYKIGVLVNGNELVYEKPVLPMFPLNKGKNGNFLEYTLVRPNPKPTIKFRNPREDLFNATGKYYYMPIDLSRMNSLQEIVKKKQKGTISLDEYDRALKSFKSYVDTLGLDATGGKGPTLRSLGYNESGKVPYRIKDGKLVYEMATYTVNDIAPGDLDGDGNDELIVKWDPSNSLDSMYSYKTSAPCIIDAYKIEDAQAHLLWRIDMGYNIRAGAHDTQILVYDFDKDGKDEVVLRTADGTTSGSVENGKYSPKYFVGEKNAAFIEDYILNNNIQMLEKYTYKILNGYSICWEDPVYNNNQGEAGEDGYITTGSYKGNILDQTWCKVYTYGPATGSGKEYITVFDGMTGAIVDSIEYKFAITESMWGINPVCRRGASCSSLIYNSDKINKEKDPGYIEQYFWVDRNNDVGNTYMMFGDSIGNRAGRFLGAIALLNGEKNSPAAIIGRGYYERTTLAAYVLKEIEGKKRLVMDSYFDSAEYQNHSDYECRGNHNLAVGDVDNDGKDEILYGSIAFEKENNNDKFIKVKYVVGVALPKGENPPPKDVPLRIEEGYDEKGRIKEGYKFTYLYHGDAIHLLPLDKSNRLVLFTPHEDSGDANRGWALAMHAHDAETGRVLVASYRPGDQGRGVAGNVNPTIPDRIVYSANISIDSKTNNLVKIGAGTNGLIYWTGSLVRQLMDDKITQISKRGDSYETVMEFPGVSFNNGTKRNPCLQADLFGDWREELILRKNEDSIRIYITNMPTEYTIPWLMQDHHYRLGVAHQNIAYNQPPHLGFFLGYDTSTEEANVLPGLEDTIIGTIVPKGNPIIQKK
ncbi:hypothetical protein C5O22_03620 [Treponema sp. J25]|nr:hypothetical protein C5O22_03620 [Treponema sp. J25]